MVYKIIIKKRFGNKLEHVLKYIEDEFGLLIAQKFADQLQQKFHTLQHQPFIGRQSPTFSQIRSIPLEKQNRIYYRIQKDKIIIINMYDTRINPKRNKLE